MHIKERMAWQDIEAFENIASKLLWVAGNSTALRVLLVEFSPHTPTRFVPEWVHALAEQLAACRPRLHAFSCRARDLNTFPVIPNLKHLMLDVRFVPLHDGMGSLVALKSLETLHLKGYVGLEPQVDFDCPPIELSSLNRLLRLALVNIRSREHFCTFFLCGPCQPVCKLHWQPSSLERHLY